ncbi:uncharacterized protein QYS62_003288 [Fusarium acuminatum]|uniref:NACHT domain-containing protein n=1 Tax=Fusarium acuminatum TaxID=5515 RepID=A0ABZ2WNK5_9HYPO
MQSSTSNSVQSLSATDASRVHVGNTYNTTQNYYKRTDQDEVKQLLKALRSTDPRLDKLRIQGTNGGLLKESYMWILETPEFLAWLNEDHESRLLWIKGDPGKGKTMLLCGIIDELLPSTRLENPESLVSLSYFFCQATHPDLRNSTAVLQGLIYLLVMQQPCLASHLQDWQGHNTAHRNSWFETEILFRKIVADPALQEAYLIVDALDECLEDLDCFLEVISCSIPHVKWVVSSRIRVEIEEHFQTLSTLGLSLELHEESVSQAISYFIDYRTHVLVKKKRLKSSIAEEVHRHLTQHAHGTFLWVALVCRELEKCRPWEISKQLLQLPENLTKLYARMMDQIRTSKSYETYIRLLAVASTVFRPITFSEVIAMEEQLNLDEETLPDVVWECGSFLTWKEQTIVFVHQSAKDFLLKEPSLFQFGLAHHHYDLFQKSISVLKSLHKDMYHMIYPGVSLDSAIRNRPKPDPLDSLVYAAVFWADHIREAHQLSIQDGTEEKIPFVDTIYNFISEKSLFWLEALSLSQNLSAAGKALLFLKDLPTQVLSQPAVISLIEDALRFLLFLNPIIESYPLQIYASGLLFSPKKSLIRNLFEQHTPKFISRRPRVDDIWSPILSVFETPPETEISTMSFSPTSEMLVITTSDSQLLIWNVSSGYIHKRSKFDNATLLTTSPDLQWLAVITMRYSSNAEKHVQDALEVRELDSNDALWTRTLNGRQALAMKISPDSRWLAMCYKDELHVYDGEGGTPRSWPLQLELDKEPSDITPWRMEFSSDCALLLLLYYNHGYGILVSDLRTGTQYKCPDSEREFTKIGEDINDAKFVPNTHLVMICDNEMCIYLWDFLKGECNEWLMNDDYVDCLAYSHADSWMATISDKEVMLLCRDQRTLLRQLELPDDEGLYAIEVSYDDTKIAVCSRTTIWVLDVGIIMGTEPSSDEQKEICPHILNDGISIAYNDLFTTIEIENPIEGAITTLDIRDSLRESVNVIALSPEGRLLAYSDGSSIHIRDLYRGHLRYSFEVHAEAEYIAISSEIGGDGQWIAVCMPFGVVVWHIDPGQFHRLIKFPDESGRHPARAFFVGTRLAVSWCFHPWERSPDIRYETLVLYDIKTGQHLTRRNLPCSCISFSSQGGNLSMSPNGKWMVSYVFGCRRLLLSDLEAGIQYAVVDIDAKWFSFIDNSTLWTNQGVFVLDCVLDDLAVESRKSRTQIVETGNQVSQELPLIIPTFDKYGRDTSGEWITFDTHPLIWLPQQYRPSPTDLGQMAIGHHHVTIESSRGTYSIVFTNDTGDYLRQAMDNLVI